MDEIMDNIIEVKNVTFEYSDGDRQKTVIKDFSVDIKRGSFTVILGHNGSGKSTLAKLLNGLYKPASGSVFVDGVDTADEENDEIKQVSEQLDDRVEATKGVHRTLSKTAEDAVCDPEFAYLVMLCGVGLGLSYSADRVFNARVDGGHLAP